ncbi:hypothetical protein Sjap_006245 [Stephania japonica]|uniref:Uncharacterized protein n=1 Tax=Stephania japonica TaxID=461633 RepID=A0AAP0K7Y3_9MAGN
MTMAKATKKNRQNEVKRVYNELTKSILRRFVEVGLVGGRVWESSSWCSL